MSASSQQFWTNCFLLGVVFVSPVSPVSLAAKGSGVVSVLFGVCGFLVCAFWFALFGFFWCFLFPSLPACLSSFTDWCLVHRQQSREQKTNGLHGQRLVLCHYLGMRYCTGGGCLGCPFTVDNEGYRDVIKGHSFRLKEPLQYDVESLFPLFAGVRPQDFPEPRLEAPQAEQALPPPDDIIDPPVFPREERSPQPVEDGVEDMDVEAGEVDVDVEPMTIDRLQEGDQMTRAKKGTVG